MADISPRLIHQGLLIKSPPEPKSKDLSRWRKRYFKLWSSKTLEYYRNEKSKDFLKKPIDLNKCKSIDGHLKNKKWGNIFCLNTVERKFFLVADSPETMKEWIVKICDLCGFGLEGSDLNSPVGKDIDSPLSSPTYVRRNGAPNLETSSGHDASPRMSPSGPFDRIPAYDQDLPPTPDSPRSRPCPDVPVVPATTPPLTLAYGKSIKQNRHKDSTGSSCPSYDTVPTPVPAEPGTLKRFLSSTSESAILNQTIKDESYVDMQPEHGGTDPAPQPLSVMYGTPGSGKPGSAYDIVPTPMPAGKLQVRSNSVTGNYDTVPAPRLNDEYIDCDTNYQQGESTAGTVQGRDPPPRPEPTYTGFDTLPIVNRRASKTEYSSSTDDIYDIPPRNSILDSLYDVPPQQLEIESQDSIYDTPPLQTHAAEQQAECLENENDSIYDHPPLSINLIEDDSIYDTPPCKKFDTEPDSIYDFPPSSKDPFSNDIYDVPPSPADLFNFDNRPPKVDRALKHASTSHLDMDRINPPPVDRKNRPLLATSVPSFPSSIEQYLSPTSNPCDSIYDSPPIRSETENCPQAAYLHGDVTSFSQQTMTYGMPSRGNLQYSDFDFASNKVQQMKQHGARKSTDYSAVDPELTAAMQNARISRDLNHFQ